MAVLDKLPGIEVTVICDGKPLQEYDCEESDLQDTSSEKGKTVTKYIESQSDKEFSIMLHITPEYKPDSPTLAYYVYMDGKSNFNSFATDTEINRRDCFKGFENPPTPAVGTGYHHQISAARYKANDVAGEWIRRPYRFAPLLTIEDSDAKRVKRDSKLAEDLGTILVKFWRKTKSQKADDSTVKTKSISAIDQVSEKALKGKTVSHTTTYGPEEKTTVQFWHNDYIDQHPLCVFKFIYKSKSALQSEHIIPRTPTPDPVEQMSNEELQRIARAHLKHLKDQEDEKKIKKEVKKEVKEEPGIKRESGSRNTGTKRKLQTGTGEIEVFDLTGDDDVLPPRKKFTWDLTED